jgi:hypothetical protein
MSTATSKWTPEYKREYNRKYYEKNRKRLSNYCKKYYKNKKIKKDIDARLGDLEYRLNLCWYDKGQIKDIPDKFKRNGPVYKFYVCSNCDHCFKKKYEFDYSLNNLT